TSSKRAWSGVAVHTYGNIASGWIRGFDVEVGVTHDRTYANVGYSFLETRDEENDFALLGRARHSGRGAVEFSLRSGTHAGVVRTFSGAAPISREGDGGAMTEVLRDA